MKNIVKWFSVAASGLAFVTTVSAHVSVTPKEMVAGYGVLTVRVPTEKDVATTGVRVLIPEGIDIGGVMPLPGWTHSETREIKEGETPVIADDGDMVPSGRITEVSWSGGKIAPGEFFEFPLSANSTGEPGKVIFKAYQTYADGSIVSWDGSDDKHPAASVSIVTSSGLGEKTQTVSESPVTASPILWLSVGAVLLSVVALTVSLKKKL